MGEVYDLICPECGCICDTVFKNKEVGNILSCSFCSRLKHDNINICDICTTFDELTCTCSKNIIKEYVNACEEFLLYDEQEAIKIFEELIKELENEKVSTEGIE